MTQEPRWLSIARELRAIAQTGLAFTADGFDRGRYERVRELAALL
jgi:Hydrolase of X-linked nucleoside diphosphate N terminal